MIAPPRKAAILGAGPAGLFALNALVRRAPDIQVDVFERLPTPFGLVRSGVAPDHQGTKAVVRQFERVFAKPGVRLLANVEIGRDITLEQIDAHYDLVLVAMGAAGDRRLSVPGEDLPGAYGSLAFTGWLNGQPDYRDLNPRLGQHVVIIGAGNVALDVARLLAKGPEELAASDLCAHARSIIGQARRISVVGRCGLANVKFDVAELQALGELACAAISLAPRQQAALSGLPSDNGLRVAFEALALKPDGRVQITFDFDLAATAILGESEVNAVRFRDRAGDMVDLSCDAVVSAIGAHPRVPDWPERFQAVGWASGAAGSIPDSRRQAAACVDTALACATPRSGPDPTRPLASRAIDWAGWKRIDRAEVESAIAPRPREKLTRWTELTRVAETI